MDELKIEKDVPIPQRRHAGKGVSKYGFEKMDVMDSINFGEVDRKGAAAITSGAIHHGKVAGKEFATRTTPEGFRVWRIK